MYQLPLVLCLRRPGRYVGSVTIEQSAAVQDPHQLAEEAAAYIARSTGVPQHDIAVVLGSGWGEAAGLIGEVTSVLNAADVPGFSAPAVVGHTGSLTSIRTPGGKNVLVLGARTHFYEGKGVRAVVHGVRTAAAAGATTMVLTARHTLNAILDTVAAVHGLNPHLRTLAREVDSTLDEGVYAQFTGPHYETPAEVQYAKRIGADLVGMSTALEAIAARAAGMEVFGISLVTNLAAGISPTPLSHGEVIEAGAAAGPRISRLLADIIAKI